ncbi:pirin-like [Acanthaster planci]|uniref:Pirin n=1 Tax=Acanthaster planci TaxID=133434 RepID=A0A8B7Y3C1_ACAPL|nr:pirin-like [Acanthaster planci]XP_022086815.1 pirin-like [Acanthaster planci]
MVTTFLHIFTLLIVSQSVILSSADHHSEVHIVTLENPHRVDIGTANFTMSRHITQAILSQEQAEGVGARVRRSVGRPELRNLDPFLLLDEFKGKKPGGFPDHPHRGFETVSYMLSGKFAHEDFAGHSGIIGPGDLQWMTAGRGIVHSEMPATEDMCHGLQLWVNLASEFKMVKPEYQELLSKHIPEVEKDGVKVRVIAGEALGKKSKVRTRTPTSYLDFTLQKGAVLDQPIPQGWTAFVYVLSGKAFFGTGEKQRQGEPHHTLVLSDGDHVHVENKASEACHFVLISGQPIGEPIVQHGPFVMNTQDEILQAISDYRSAVNGFEKARTWRSKMGSTF